jgi:uncharacterized repeat protein (TIGR01451 family)
MRLILGITFGVAAVLPMAAAPTANAVVPVGTVSGIAFRDLNADGIKNGAEQFLAGVFISAGGQTAGPDTVANTGDDVVTVYGPVRTGPSGGWSIPGVISDSKVRVEVAGFDANGNGSLDSTEHQLPSWLKPTFKGSDNGTNVQFVAASGAANVRFGFENPADFCQASAALATTCFINGDTTGNTAQFALHTVSASGGPSNALVPVANMGASYGVAYNRSTRQTITSAYVKRHAGLGPKGIGGIYAFDKVTGIPVWSIDVTVLGADVGSIGSNSSRGLAAVTDPSTDATAFALVGRAGIGDIDVSEDSTKLWFTSFADGKLYSLALPADGTEPTATAVGVPIVSACDRPMAVAPHDGKIFVGVACSDASKAEIVVFDPVATAWSSVLQIPLNYAKGCAVAGGAGTSCHWNAWTDVYDAATMEHGSEYVGAIYPQPMFSDIVFDNDGSIIAGFRDRFGDQVGHRNRRPDGAFPANHGITGISGGDILRVCNVAGSLVLQGGIGCVDNALNNEGPGGGEFYPNDNFVQATIAQHAETSDGGLAFISGGSTVYTTSLDPSLSMDAGGVSLFDSLTGAKTASSEVYQNGADHPPTFGKSNGIGDLEALCDEAPVQIGNRVWLDSDRDGVQDPNEAPIAGATVTMYTAGTSAVMGTTTTDGNGEYYFSSTAFPQLTSGAQISLGVAPSLTIDGANTVSSSGTGVSLTSRSVTAGSLGSDADSATGRTATFTIAGAGGNDHAWDFGYSTSLPTIDLEIAKALLSAGTVRTGDLAEFGLTVKNNGPSATTRAFSVVDRLPQGMTPVSASGAGFVCALPVGQEITCTQTPFVSLGVGASASQIVVNATVASPVTGRLTNFAKVVPDTGELAETNPLGTENGGYETGDPTASSNNDASASVTGNPPVDEPLYHVGNRVWLDANNNSQIDAESGLSGATVELLSASGITLSATTTNSAGYYRFDALTAGDYSIRVTAPPGYVSSSTDSPGPNDDIDATATNASDNGIGSGNVATSGIITLGGAPEPLNESDLVAGPLAQGGPDANSNMTVDFGFREQAPLAASLGDTVWFDNNNDGVQDVTEPGVPGVTVRLYSANIAVATTTTNAVGQYRFDHLTPGESETVEFVATSLPAGYVFTRPFAGGEATDSDADPMTGRTKTYILATGEHNPTLDAGIVQRSTVTGPVIVLTPTTVAETAPTTTPPAAAAVVAMTTTAPTHIRLGGSQSGRRAPGRRAGHARRHCRSDDARGNRPESGHRRQRLLPVRGACAGDLYARSGRNGRSEQRSKSPHRSDLHRYGALRGQPRPGFRVQHTGRVRRIDLERSDRLHGRQHGPAGRSCRRPDTSRPPGPLGGAMGLPGRREGRTVTPPHHRRTPVRADSLRTCSRISRSKPLPIESVTTSTSLPMWARWKSRSC